MGCVAIHDLDLFEASELGLKSVARGSMKMLRAPAKKHGAELTVRA
jgi:hypothetical protein